MRNELRSGILDVAHLLENLHVAQRAKLYQVSWDSNILPRPIATALKFLEVHGPLATCVASFGLIVSRKMGSAVFEMSTHDAALIIRVYTFLCQSMFGDDGGTTMLYVVDVTVAKNGHVCKWSLLASR